MGTPYEAGGGAPRFFTGFAGPFPASGGGDVYGGLDAGGGDPYLISDETLHLTPSWFPFDFDGPLLRDRASANQVMEEGGQVIGVMRMVLPWDTKREPFNVKVRDVLSNLHPLLEDGCYSARMGRGTACRSYAGGRIVRFVMPPLPLGVYDIIVTTPSGSIATIVHAFRVLPTPDSLEVKAIRRLPRRVYTKAFGED
jgi:hypothetical protein